jgi:signal transduction histidine kinase/CheY-like chemotaxis protein
MWKEAVEKKTNYEIEYRLRRYDGNYRYFLTRGVPLFAKDGSILEWVGTCIDITERKELEKQLIQSQRLEAIGRLSGGIAHDFNNLMTAVVGYSDLLTMKLVHDSDICKDIEQIKKAGQSAASLSRQLLAFSRKQILQPRVVDLNHIVDDIDKVLQRVIGEDISLITVLEPQLGYISVDPGQMEQVIMNIAVNARDAMPNGGKLTIETGNVYQDERYAQKYLGFQPGSYVMLAMTDTGTGMDEETKSHIFEPFFTTKEEGKGTGLGMSTVYGIVRQSNGHIFVYTEPGRGTTFKIYLPRIEGNAEPEEKEELAVKVLNGTETLLVVEDNDSVRNLARKVLGDYGYTILEAEDGESALKLSEAHEGSIHLMLVDIVMPGISARDLVGRLKTFRPQMKVLYMSGYTENAIVHQGILTPGTPFLQKPFTPVGLVSKVREVLDS